MTALAWLLLNSTETVAALFGLGYSPCTVDLSGAFPTGKLLFPPKPGEHLGDYLIAERLPPRYQMPPDVQALPLPPTTVPLPVVPHLPHALPVPDVPPMPVPLPPPEAFEGPRRGRDPGDKFDTMTEPLSLPRPVKNATARTAINFAGPTEMKVAWQSPNGTFNDTTALLAPNAYNFLPGKTYRLRVTLLGAKGAGRSFYPLVEVAPVAPKTRIYLQHASVPVAFTVDDFEQAKNGTLVVKVIYLPDPLGQDFSTVLGAEELVSTKLEKGADPIAEAQRRGTVLAVVRMGNIDLEGRGHPRSHDR